MVTEALRCPTRSFPGAPMASMVVPSWKGLPWLGQIKPQLVAVDSLNPWPEPRLKVQVLTHMCN